MSASSCLKAHSGLFWFQKQSCVPLPLRLHLFSFIITHLRRFLAVHLLLKPLASGPPTLLKLLLLRAWWHPCSLVTCFLFYRSSWSTCWAEPLFFSFKFLNFWFFPVLCTVSIYHPAFQYCCFLGSICTANCVPVAFPGWKTTCHRRWLQVVPELLLMGCHAYLYLQHLFSEPCLSWSVIIWGGLRSARL